MVIKFLPFLLEQLRLHQKLVLHRWLIGTTRSSWLPRFLGKIPDNHCLKLSSLSTSHIFIKENSGHTTTKHERPLDCASVKTKLIARRMRACTSHKTAARVSVVQVVQKWYKRHKFVINRQYAFEKFCLTPVPLIFWQTSYYQRQLHWMSLISAKYAVLIACTSNSSGTVFRV